MKQHKPSKFFARHPNATGEHRGIDNGNPDAIGDVDQDGYVALHHCYVAASGEHSILIHHDGGKFWISRSVLKVQVRKGHSGDVVLKEEYARQREII